MKRFGQPSSLYVDLVASSLRSQVMALRNILDAIERTHSYEDEYINESLKVAESEIRRIRKFIDD